MMMNCAKLKSVVFTGILALALLQSTAAAQIQVPGGREAMWPAPTVEDWRKPVGITFQRTWEDAVALSKDSGKAILVCINMDGEIASEHYAGIRYRQPDITKLYEPYICVIASTYRHTPHDHDENGERIPCPRFGSVTCGEHISIEPYLFEKYMEGKRIAPRHIMVELDGQETYDVYHAFDTDSVFKAIEDGITKRKIQPKPQVKGDRTLVEKVASRDIKDRVEVESAFKNGDKDLRRSLLLAAIEQGANGPTELLRLGLFGFDEEMNALARKALQKTESKGSTDLIAEALSVPLEPQERNALLGALDRLGKKVPKARRLAQVQRGLSSDSKDVKTATWQRAIAQGATYTPASREAVSGTLKAQNESFESKDPKERLSLARAFLSRATASPSDSRAERRVRDALLGDAIEAAKATLELEEDNWGATTILAVSNYYLGKKDKAYEFAITAGKLTPDQPQSHQAMLVMGLLAEHRRNQISDAIRDKKDWPRSWLTDLHAAYGVLGKHPHGDASQVTMHYDFLVWLGAWGKANRALRNGMTRFPNSWAIHDRYRTRILNRYGVARLEASYAKLMEQENAHPNLPWYAGYASLVAAEFHRRSNRFDKALKSYDLGISLFEKASAADEDNRKTSDHYVAMAHGGKARIYYEQNKNAQGVKEILASLNRSQGSGATLDGLNISTVDTAKMMRQRLHEKKNTDLGATLEEALKKLPRELLKLPAYESGPPKK
ncbi:MAG: hypothetical protein ACI97A_002879 [Planctomycetota bacterium]|jgi:hypothetical protein